MSKTYVLKKILIPMSISLWKGCLLYVDHDDNDDDADDI